MAKLKVHRAFDEFLLDPNLSLRAKGFLTMQPDRIEESKFYIISLFYKNLLALKYQLHTIYIRKKAYIIRM